MNDDLEGRRQPFVLSARDELLERARNGEITPKEAEAEAYRMGMAPLAGRPADNQFDPRGKPRWSLSMALAWIVWRDFDQVRQRDIEYRTHCWNWQPSNVSLPVDGSAATKVVRGFTVVRLRPTSPVPFELYDAIAITPRRQLSPDWSPNRSPFEAKADLWAALLDARLVAEAIPALGGPRIEVPAREWTDLENVTDGKLNGEYFRYRHQPHGRAYSDIVWRRDDLVRLWPEASGLASGVPARPARRAGTNKDAIDFRKWVEVRLASGETPPTRSDSVLWAADRNIGVEWARKTHTALPQEMKLARGETPTRPLLKRR
jgi:hypothetical protein